jgi:hypothetical protein
VAIVLSLFFAWLLAAQVVILSQGWELYQGTAGRMEGGAEMAPAVEIEAEKPPVFEPEIETPPAGEADADSTELAKEE